MKNSKVLELLILAMTLTVVAIIMSATYRMGYNVGRLEAANQKPEEKQIIVVSQGFNWTTTQLGQVIPIPAYTQSKIEVDTPEQFIVYFSNISNEGFNEYIDKCKEYGFTVNAIREIDSNNVDCYTAENEEGYTLNLKHISHNVLRIEVLIY